MRILQLLTDLAPAGAEKVVLELSKELKKRGHIIAVVELLPLPANSVMLDGFKREGIPVESIALSKSAPHRILKLYRTIRNFRPDVIHSHLIHANIAARIVNSRRVPLVNTVHIAERRPSKTWHFLLDRLTFPLCHVQTCVSNAVRDFHSAKIHVRPERMTVIYNGVPKPTIPSTEQIQALRFEWGMTDCDRIIGAVGRLDPQKGFDLLLTATRELAGILPTGNTWGIVILGEGSQRAELENIAATMPTNIRCVMPGFRPDAADCIGAFDLFAMPSRYEGFGLSLVEAMFHGVPILSSDADSLPELMSDYSNGASLRQITANNLLTWANRPKQTAALCAAPHTVAEMTDGYMRIFESLLESHK